MYNSRLGIDVKNIYKIAVIAGCRPDFIRLSVILKKLAANPKTDLLFIHTGQHYSNNLSEVFFDEMGLVRPNYILDCANGSAVSQHSRLLASLEPILEKEKPDCCIFLGDTNAVMGCIAPWKMGIPVVHIEGLMRAYDLDMPEERNRIIADRISSVLYVYHEDSRVRAAQEGICPTKVVTIGNTIVDVLKEYAANIKPEEVCAKMGLEPQKFALFTLHRDGNMNKDHVMRFFNSIALWNVTRFDGSLPIVTILMPRLKAILESLECNINHWMDYNFRFVDPLGFFDFISLEKAAKIEFTDSGTNQETSSLQGTPCVVLRENTERPETFQSNITRMAFSANDIRKAATSVLHSKPNPNYSLGTGNSASMLIEDLLARLDRDFDRSIHASTNKFIARNWL